MKTDRRSFCQELAVGCVASPQRDPSLDWYAGGWIGGRVDAMDALVELANDETRIVRSAEDMLEAGVMNGLGRRFQDPSRFFYDLSKGLWAHYTNFGGNVV
jgi:hypothetical protein